MGRLQAAHCRRLESRAGAAGTRALRDHLLSPHLELGHGDRTVREVHDRTPFALRGEGFAVPGALRRTVARPVGWSAGQSSRTNRIHRADDRAIPASPRIPRTHQPSTSRRAITSRSATAACTTRATASSAPTRRTSCWSSAATSSATAMSARSMSTTTTPRRRARRSSSTASGRCWPVRAATTSRTARPASSSATTGSSTPTASSTSCTPKTAPSCARTRATGPPTSTGT